MEGVILILCLLMTFLLMGVLLSGAYRLRESFRRLQEEIAGDKISERTIIVKQAGRVMKIAYYTEPKEHVRESIKDIIARETALAKTSPEVKNSESSEQAIIQDSVLIQRSEKLSFDQKYERLPKDKKRLLDEFTEHIMGKFECEKLLQTGAMSFRYRKGLIVKAVIRRDTPILYFNLKNPEFGRMVREEKFKSVKVQPVELRLSNAEELTLAKQTADITVSYLQTEEKYKIEKRKAARREAARLRRMTGEVT